MPFADITVRLEFPETFDAEDLNPLIGKIIHDAHKNGALDLPSGENPRSAVIQCASVSRIDSNWLDDDSRGQKFVFTGSPEDRHTIIAALRFWQEEEMCEPSRRSDEMQDIATCGDELTSLCSDDIDTLIEQLNT